MLSSLAQLGSRLYGWLLGALVAAAAVIGIYMRGRSAGKKVERTKQAEHELADERARSGAIQEASNVQTEIARLPADAVHQRLRQHWQRD